MGDNLVDRNSSWLIKHRLFLESVFTIISTIWVMIVVIPPTDLWIPASIKLGVLIVLGIILIGIRLGRYYWPHNVEDFK